MRDLDLFGSNILVTHNGKSSHKTFLGSFCTILIYPSLVMLFIYMILLFDLSSQDVVFTSTDSYAQDDPHDGMLLNQTGQPQLRFKFYVEDPKFDNDDNPYGRVVMHMYSNMDNINDTKKGIDQSGRGYNDIEIPIKVCNEFEPEWKADKIYNYCPDF